MCTWLPTLLLASSIVRVIVDIDEAVLREVKAICQKEGRSMAAVVSALLADALAQRRTTRERPAFRWTSCPMTALVELTAQNALHTALDDERSRPT